MAYAIKKILDKDIINRLRISGMRDIHIAIQLEVHSREIGKQCGNRKDSNIPLAKKVSLIPYTLDRKLNKVLWENKDHPIPYWINESNITHSSGGPIPILNEFKHGW